MNPEQNPKKNIETEQIIFDRHNSNVGGYMFDVTQTNSRQQESNINIRKKTWKSN